MKFIETSTINNKNVKSAFELLLAEIYSQRQNQTKDYYARQPFRMLDTPTP